MKSTDKYISNFVRRMVAADPAYGSQEHQRTFVDRLNRAQAARPCTKNHDGDADGLAEHSLTGKDACFALKDLP